MKLFGVGLTALAGSAMLAMAEPEEATQTVAADAAEQSVLVAIADAQASFDVFWTAYQAQAPGTDKFAVKVGFLTGHGGTEHLWVTDIDQQGETYRGKLGSTPKIIDAQRGGAVVFTARDVTDWGYAEGSKLRGHFTTRVNLPEMDPVDVEYMASLLHDDPVPSDGANE